MPTSPALEVRGLCKSFRTRDGLLPILRNLDFTLCAGESAAIMGPSGSGKSTLLNILGTLETTDDGRVVVGGCDVTSLSPADVALFRNQSIGFVFQEHHLLPQCNVLENVLLPTLVKANHHANAMDRARTLLARVGLSERLAHRPAELSGGERQRVAIARALINAPPILLADEPTGNLDRATAESVAQLLYSLPASENVALVVVTHSDKLADMASSRWELQDGALVRR